MPSRKASRLRLNCLPTTWPFAAVRCSGELPSAPFSTGPLKRALASTGPPALLAIIAGPIGQIGSRVRSSLSEPVCR